MPLSEHEERILAEIERQLAEDDPRFGSKRSSFRTPLSTWSRTLRLRLAVGLGVVGVLCVLGLAASTALAAVGLAMIFAAILVGATAVRERLQPDAPRQPSPDDVL
jgi:hypothetical protein